ncbi:hypothetical protein, partial [Vibrio parahaemolyticus]|uniref:hypothetical protein n=2 Tax=Vibrio parahaemolyticus TaxID=670 RepID=UPI000472D7D2
TATTATTAINIKKVSTNTEKKYNFLIFDREQNLLKRVLSETGKLPRTKEDAYVPYGLSLNDEVVYIKYGSHSGYNNTQLKSLYDSKISFIRQKQCQSKLAEIVLTQPEITKKAVDQVTRGVMSFLKDMQNKDPFLLEKLHKSIGHYFYTNGRLSFGRLSTDNINTISQDDFYQKLLDTLISGSLEQVLAIHDAIGRKILPYYPSKTLDIYQSISNTVRESWFDDCKIRGRRIINKTPSPSSIIGITDDSDIGITPNIQPRQRAIDMYQRDDTRQSHPIANNYYDGVDEHNLLFVAGISGTTGTLLQAAKAFGELEDIELKKQYVLGIMGYLVGGGMHSFHEVMTIASRIGIPYHPGRMNDVLPDSFTHTLAYHQWQAKYYDIVELGALHWRYNIQPLPSHLNTNLS